MWKMKDRFEIAADLRAIANLLRIKGENPFKVQAYERGAAALENLQGDLDTLVKQHRLQEIPGIGGALSATIEEIHETGESWLLQQLRDSLPPGAVELAAMPGLTLNKITALHETLNIESLADLKAACEQGLVSRVKGFGVKSQAKLLADIAKRGRQPEGFLLLHEALVEAEKILAYLRACPELSQSDVGGALRRRKEMIRTIAIVGASTQPKVVIERFLRYPALLRTDDLADDRCLARLPSGVGAELIIVDPADYWTTLHCRTGSRSHIARLDQIAATKPSKNTVRKQSSVASEADIYRRLGLAFIPPEMREDEGEIEAAATGKLPVPLELQDIRGMTHCHTVYSDGRNSVEEMARAAEALGMDYLTITDHSQSAYYARGLTLDRLRAQWDEIERVQEQVKIKLLKGTESDILADGALDYSDAILEKFDIVIASIHSRHKMDSAQMTARLVRALELPIFKIWGHPRGRLLRSRPPFDCRMEEVLDAIAESRGAIEVNGDPRRLDLEPRWIREARARQIKFVVSTDAHSVSGLNYLRFGVAMARRGWLTRHEVLNTLSTEQFMRAVHP